MSKRRNWISFAVFAVVILLVAGYFWFPIRPFSALTAEKVASMSIFAAPPGQTIELSQDEMEQAVALLNKVKVSQRGYAYSPEDYDGQGILFNIQKTDGTEQSLLFSCNMAVIVDGTTYRAEYDSSEAISAFANDLLRTHKDAIQDGKNVSGGNTTTDVIATKMTFEAKVIEVQDGVLTVEPLMGMPERDLSDSIAIHTENLAELATCEYVARAQVGDKIKVCYLKENSNIGIGEIDVYQIIPLEEVCN